MDGRLVTWARSVKARRGSGAGLPVLWLFTDADRMPDPLPAIARLPRGLCGVVFRHDGVAGREALARRVAACCQARGIALSVASDWRLAAALDAGEHLRAGERRRGGRFATASAHDRAQVRRAVSRGADLVFLSPVFATASHPGAEPLGVLRWRLAARGCRMPVLALGGISGASVRALPKWCAGAGAIGAWRGGMAGLEDAKRVPRKPCSP